MKVFIGFMVTILCCSLITAAGAESIKLAGSGQMIPLINTLGKAYMKKYPQDAVEVNQKSLGQLGGVMAVTKGAIDIAMSARYLDKNEKKMPVQAYEIAKVAGLFAVNAATPVTSLTSQQVCDIYGGKIRNWAKLGGPDGAIIPLTRPESDSTKIAVRQGIACFDKLKEADDVRSMPKAKDMYTELTTKVNTLGMIDAVCFADAGGKLKAVKIDGKDFTSSENSPIMHHYNLVLGKNRGEAVMRFLQFIRSSEGQTIIKREKASPMPFGL
ncbi:substrate-binding domain-containing protein [Geobacter argillaceus]|uniref:Phosphate ABC transporter substrate-binding protein (PhoT family) n=1 Tax=Geobacter argillaceus TaxID=345631 RepID=A0A562VPZ6_9BACT|nr:substrate-binding domain-containing protein [Geobacter argillaceus]TWJ19797.1 phosphate ABC transporter substrate-binding protein (PhoT family) [Geobacter argillaceus]